MWSNQNVRAFVTSPPTRQLFLGIQDARHAPKDIINLVDPAIDIIILILAEIKKKELICVIRLDLFPEIDIQDRLRDQNNSRNT